MHECELLIFFFPLFPFSVLFNKMSLAVDIMYDAIKKSLSSWGKGLFAKFVKHKQKRNKSLSKIKKKKQL